MRPLRVFVDTSVFGGMFDPEFAADTEAFFAQVSSHRFQVAVSVQVDREIIRAPVHVRDFYAACMPRALYLEENPEALRLAEVYLAAGILGEKSMTDALHVAYAVAYGCDGVVSWNFKHILHPDRAARFNVVNLSEGYPQLFIASPKEVARHENGSPKE